MDADRVEQLALEPVRPELEDRVGRAGATLRVLVAAGRDARPAVRFPDAVLEAAR